MPTSRQRIWLLFFVHGLIVATWVSRIPAIQGRLHLSSGGLGLALLGAAAGSLFALPAAGWLIARFGSKPVTALSSVDDVPPSAACGSGRCSGCRSSAGGSIPIVGVDALGPE